MYQLRRANHHRRYIVRLRLALPVVADRAGRGLSPKWALKDWLDIIEACAAHLICC